MKDVAYYDGKIGRIDELQAPITDRGLYFGDGIYDATACLNKKPFALREHLDRFYSGLSQLQIPAPMERGKLDALLHDLCARVDSDEGHICYWQVTRGAAHRGHAFPKDAPPRLMAFVEPIALDRHSDRLKLMTVPDTRYFHCNVKTLNLLPNVLASQQAREAGCDEVVFHREEQVTECAHSNIALFKDGVFITPPLSNLILPGITRKHCLELCAALGIPTQERRITVDELFTADELLVLSSGCMGVSACELDGKPVGGKAPQPLQALQQAYLNKFLQDTAK